jgi:hypothetical protein
VRAPWSQPSRDDLLAIYLNDHLMGATGGVELFRRASKSQLDQFRRVALSQLGTESAKDRESLVEVMRLLDVAVSRSRVAAGWLAEKAGRLKLNGSALRRSPLSDLVELEGLLLGVEGKSCLWRSLRMLAAHDDRLEPSQFDELEQRALAQMAELERLRLSGVTMLLSG